MKTSASAKIIGRADVARGLVRSARQLSVELVPKGPRSIFNSGAAHPVDPQRINETARTEKGGESRRPFLSRTLSEERREDIPPKVSPSRMEVSLVSKNTTIRMMPTPKRGSFSAGL